MSNGIFEFFQMYAKKKKLVKLTQTIWGYTSSREYQILACQLWKGMVFLWVFFTVIVDKIYYSSLLDYYTIIRFS